MEKKVECEIVQDLLLSYVDGILNQESKKLVEKHLLECNSCQEKLEDIKKDIKQKEKNQKIEIDYLKKIRIKTRIKSIVLAIFIIFIICFIIYLNKFIKINDIANKAKKTLETNNFYKETSQVMSDKETIVTKEYYKDGKYKQVDEIYSDDNVKINYIVYRTEGSDEELEVNQEEKKVTINKNEFVKIMSEKKTLKGDTMYVEGYTSNLFFRLGMAFFKSISTDTYEIGREYYVIKEQFGENKKWEMWIDKQTGLPLKVINRDASRTHYAGTNVQKGFDKDNIQKYKYEFGIVTDEDVKVPDLTEYTVEYSNYNLENFGTE